MSIQPSRWLLSFFLVAVSGYAQSISGSIAGHVVDQQGASVPNVSVTVTEPAKNLQFSVKTGGQGDFTFPALQPGTYNVVVESQGFKKFRARISP